MAVTLQNLYDRIDDLRVDPTSGSADVTTQGLRAVNARLDALQSLHDWEHTLREYRFRYYPRVTKYGALPTNYKNPRALAPVSNFYDEFRRIEPSIFDHLTASYERDNFYSLFEDAEGSFLQVFKYRTKAKWTTVSINSSLTSDGTWSANTSTSDCANLAADTIVFHENTGSLAFDVVVGQSGSDYSEFSNSTMTAKVLTDYKNGKCFMWVYIPSVTNFTSFTLRLGSSSSNYKTQTVTARSNGESFIAGWNLLGFDLESSTSVGSPNLALVTYVLFRATHGASYTSQVNFRVGEMWVSTYEDMVFRYYAADTVNDVSVPGTTLPRFDGTSTSDTLVFPDIFKEALCYGAAAEMLYFQEEPDLAKKREQQAADMIQMLQNRWPAKTQFPEPPAMYPDNPWGL